jgi:hypothetical protein
MKGSAAESLSRRASSQCNSSIRWLFALLAVYLIVEIAAFLIWLVFAPVLWLSQRPGRQRVELRHNSVE